MVKKIRAAITGLGMSVPQKVLTNQDFEKFLDTSDEWITQRTGIKSRRIVQNGQTTATLGTQAAREALAFAGLEANQLDMIICATITPEMPFPATACFIQQALEVKDIPAFDISAACSGFIYGLTIGSQFIQNNIYRRVLVIGAETLSRFTDYQDRSSCILFGDGAGAAVLEATDDDRGVLYSVMKTDGAGWDFIHVPGGGSRSPAGEQTIAARQHYIKMRGRDVYKFAVEKMQWLLGDCMAKCNLKADDIDLVVPHQVNIRIIESAASKMLLPMDKFFINIDKYGNTSAASVPIALKEAHQAGRIGPGSVVLLVAFGAGLTWAGAVVRF